MKIGFVLSGLIGVTAADAMVMNGAGRGFGMVGKSVADMPIVVVVSGQKPIDPELLTLVEVLHQ